MKTFPLESLTLPESAELLRQAGDWGGADARIQVPQFGRLLQVVQDISRTPAGSRVAETYRNVHIWGEEALSARTLPPAGAASLFLACRREASALLELGYPRNTGIDFIADLPGPGLNPVRSPAQSRAAIHHLGGDTGLFLELVNHHVPGHYALKAVFSVWPREGRVPDPWVGREKVFSMLLPSRDDRVPAVVSMSTRLYGYCLLCCYDLAGRLEAVAGGRRRQGTFELFAGGLKP